MESTKKEHQFLEIGLEHLLLQNVTAFKCLACNKVFIQPLDMDLLGKIAVKELLVKPGLLSGEEIRFLRETSKTEAWALANTLPIERAKLRRIESGQESVDHRLDIRMRVYFSERFEVWGWIEKNIEFYEKFYIGLKSVTLSSKINPLAITIDLSNNSVMSALTIN